jgi:hypothetical protein
MDYKGVEELTGVLSGSRFKMSYEAAKNTYTGFGTKFKILARLAQLHKEGKAKFTEEDAQEAEDEVELIEPNTDLVPIMDIISDAESEPLADKDELFSSDIPAVHAALQGYLPRKRFRVKTQDPQIPKIDFGFDIAALTKTSTHDISPDTFKELNKKMKTKHQKKGKQQKGAKKKTHRKKKPRKQQKKAVEKTKPKKNPIKKADNQDHQEPAEVRAKMFHAFLKREHSKAWVSGKKDAIARWLSEAEYKAAASNAGRIKTAKLRQDYADGKINHKGIAAEDVH